MFNHDKCTSSLYIVLVAFEPHQSTASHRYVTFGRDLYRPLNKRLDDAESIGRIRCFSYLLVEMFDNEKQWKSKEEKNRKTTRCAHRMATFVFRWVSRKSSWFVFSPNEVKCHDRMCRIAVNDFIRREINVDYWLVYVSTGAHRRVTTILSICQDIRSNCLTTTK
jgi:hypothetical protein